MPLFGDLVLASGSPRRSELLRQFGLDFIVAPSPAPEPPPHPQEPPEDYVVRTALHKAKDVQPSFPDDHWILAADTIVVQNQRILGKPTSTQHAQEMLQQLQGQLHSVHTGFVLLHKARRIEYTEQVKTLVQFRTFSPEHITRYIQSGEPMDKAGAYGIQGLGGSLVQRIDGCYFNVVGLPVSRIGEVFEELGLGSLL